MKTLTIGKLKHNGKRVLMIRGHDLKCWRIRFRNWRIERRWKKTYPDYCRACSGWGGAGYFATRWEPEGFDICEAIDFEVCHRCGKRGMDEDGNGPCTFCNWEHDDGLLAGTEYECGCYWMVEPDEDIGDSIFY